METQDRLVCLLLTEIESALDGTSEFFTLCDKSRSERYVQGASLDGDILLEVGADRFLGDDPLGDDGVKRLVARGWSEADVDHMNHWRTWPGGEVSAAAEELAEVLREIVVGYEPTELIVTRDGVSYQSVASPTGAHLRLVGSAD